MKSLGFFKQLPANDIDSTLDRAIIAEVLSETIHEIVIR